MPETVIYRYQRYGVTGEERMPSLDAALRRATSDIEGNAAVPLEIVDGTTTYDYDAILRLAYPDAVDDD